MRSARLRYQIDIHSSSAIANQNGRVPTAIGPEPNVRSNTESGYYVTLANPCAHPGSAAAVKPMGSFV